MEYQRTWRNRREKSRSTGDQVPSSYYGAPVIHKPHWKWLIIVYFFLGGIAGASYTIASVAQLVGGRGGRPIARTGRYVSLAALLPCLVLLILDLGRPERFLYMLRVFKLRSAMSLGSWAITVFGGFCGLSALGQAADDGLLRKLPYLPVLLGRLPLRGIGVLGSVFGLFVSGYTGVLLAVTAVPLWAKSGLLIGPLFLASSVGNATAAITLVLALVRGTSHGTLKRLERLELIALIAELGLLLTLRRKLGAVIDRPLRTGHIGQAYNWGVLGMGMSVPLLLHGARTVLGNKLGAWVPALAAVLTLCGGFALRYVMVVAGRASADDPDATFVFTQKRPAPSPSTQR